MKNWDASKTQSENWNISYKESVTIFLASGFFHESSSPMPIKITLGSFQIACENSQILHRYQRRWRYIFHPPAPLVSLILVANLPPVSTAPAAAGNGKSSIVEERLYSFFFAFYQSAYTLKWTWRKKFIYMLTLLPKGVQTKYFKLFLLKIFSICEYLCKFSKKILNEPIWILRDFGETDSWKNPEVENLVALSL